jgi:hypothetical protein
VVRGFSRQVIIEPLAGTLSELRGVPGCLEPGGPAEAGRHTRILRPASGHRKRHRRPGPPGHPQVLVHFQGFNEMMDGALLLAQLLLNPLGYEQLEKGLVRNVALVGQDLEPIDHGLRQAD